MAKEPTEKLHTKGTVAEVVTCALVIIGHAEDYLTILVAQRPLWADPYFTTLSTRFTGYLSSFSQRQQTTIVDNPAKQAKNGLSSFKIQLDADFRKNKIRLTEILDNLGFSLYFKKAINGGESNLVSLLERFNTNMTTGLQTEIVTAGGNIANITLLKTLAATFPIACTLKEKLKGDKKTVTEAQVIDFNYAYNELKAVCKTATNIYKTDAVKKQLFFYAHTLSILRGGTPAKPVPPTPVPPANP